MRVWIDQDCCTGAGLCVDHCPELFIVLDDGIGYVRDGMNVMTDPDDPSVAVPRRYEQAAIDAVERHATRVVTHSDSNFTLDIYEATT